MQEPKFNGLDQDLGLELLMNPRKKQGSDVISLGSRSEIQSDAGSVRSVTIEPAVIDVGQHIRQNAGVDEDFEEDDFEEDYDEDDYSEESERTPPPRKQSQGYNASYNAGFNKQNIPLNKGKPPALSETSSEGGASQVESLGSLMHDNKVKRMSEEQVLIMKKELLYQFERLEKKGVKLPRKFTLSSSLEDMKMEYERIKRDKEIDSAVKLQRRIMMSVVSGVEWLNGKFDPVGARLDGWSDSIYENIDDYDEIFEELHDKYKGKAKMAPEVKLLMMLGGSAFMHHMSHSMFKDQLPGLNDILKQNPELARQLAAATTQHMATQQTSANSLFGSLGNMVSGFFGGGGNASQQQPPAPQQQYQRPMSPQSSFPFPPPPRPSNPPPPMQPRTNMKGPSDVDDLLREFEANMASADNDRIEIMSAITASEMTDIAADDTSSINGLIMGAKKSAKKGRGASKITLDI